jgi:hypothetical protein
MPNVKKYSRAFMLFKLAKLIGLDTIIADAPFTGISNVSLAPALPIGIIVHELLYSQVVISLIIPLGKSVYCHNYI